MDSIHFKKPKTYTLQGRYQFQGLPISVENKKGGFRYGTDGDGHSWKTKMYFDYGYIRGTNGNDNEAVDVYVGPDQQAIGVYIVHQHKIEAVKDPKKYRRSGKKFVCKKCKFETSKCTHNYDEDKVMLGFSSKEAAINAYNNQYDHPGFLGPVSTYTVEEFKRMLKGDKKKIPFRRLEKAISDIASQKRPLFLTMKKSFIQQSVRHTKSGKTVVVKAYTDKRTKNTDDNASKNSKWDGLPEKEKRKLYIAAMIKKYGKLNIIPPMGSKFVSGGGKDNWVLKFNSPKTGKTVHAYSESRMVEKSEAKFEKLKALKTTLPKLRSKIESDIKTGSPKEKISAVISLLIDKSYIRIGTESNTAHGVFGVTTLRAKHVSVDGDAVTLDYIGKHKVAQKKVIKDEKIAKIIKELKDKTGAEDRIFWYSENSKTVNVDGSTVNKYLKNFGMTAKQFRTFHGTKEALSFLDSKGVAKNKKEMNKNISDAFKYVSGLLGNTPLVARKSYVSPEIIANYENKHSF